MTQYVGPRTVSLDLIEAREHATPHSIPLDAYDRERFDDVAFMTAMTLVLLGNYSQTGHYGGPLAYTPYNVAVHLVGPQRGGLRYDIRRPKHPNGDKFMLAGGHSIPTCYALWMILYEAMARQLEATGDPAFACDPRDAVLAIDALGFRRGPDAVRRLLPEAGLTGDPLFAQAGLRGIRPLMGHSESTDVTNDVNGGPSGIGIATAAGKAVFWDYFGAPRSLKVIALEGEFALTEGHAQELKTAALAHKVGKRLRVLMSLNNAGIDDTLLGGVIDSAYPAYDIAAQWASYGWNVLGLADGNDFDQIVAALQAMESWPENDGRPLIAVGRTLKGWWPEAHDGRLPDGEPLLVSYPSHPYALPMNGRYFQALAETYESRYGVTFEGIRDGVPPTEAERLRQFKTNIDICLSVMDRGNGLREWIATRLLEIAGHLEADLPLRADVTVDPFLDERLEVRNLPVEPVEVAEANPITGASVSRTIRLFQPPGAKAGTRRAISEIGAWLNHVTRHRFFTIAADLSDSINLEHANFFGHYDPVANPAGTRLKAPIQEAVNASTIIGLVSQNASPDGDRFAGVWGVSGTYGAFTPLMYTPARVFSQQNQDSPFRLGVLVILAGHSGPETAADARTHFGIFAPQVWTLFPRGQIVNLYFWDYNDVAPGFFAAAEHAAREPEVGIIAIHVARPDFPVADRSTFADSDLTAAAKGIYLIRDFVADRPAMGTVWVQGSSSTVNLLKALPRLEAEGANVRIAAVISPELFAYQSDDYRRHVLPDSARFDSMVVSTMTKRVPPIHDLGPLTEEYSLYADHDDRWRTGGTEPDVIAEARLDPDAIFEGVMRFARDRDRRLGRQREALGKL
jgi:transketolase